MKKSLMENLTVSHLTICSKFTKGFCIMVNTMSINSPSPHMSFPPPKSETNSSNQNWLCSTAVNNKVTKPVLGFILSENVTSIWT